MSNNIYHYVYIITELSTGVKYIGSRSCSNHPSMDIGHSYFSSSTDKTFMKNQKENRTNYTYEILSIFKSRYEAVTEEIRLHNLHDVGINKEFYNKSKQTSTGFDVCGKMIARTKSGATLLVSVNDDRLKSGELCHYTTGKIVVKDKNGTIFMIDKDDPRYLSGDLVGYSKGKVIVKDKNGNTMKVNKDDPRYLSGELIPINTGRKLSDDQKMAISKSSKGHKKSAETRARMSIAFKGKIVSDAAKLNISISAKNRPRGICFHCGKESDLANLGRWHNDFCKKKSS